MADFRKWFYALAVVALLAGFTVPMSAQAPPFQCVANAGVPPIVRAEGYTELVGDLVLNCSGGVPTPRGQFVPPVNVTILLSTNVTSKYLASTLFNEALLIIDEPHSSQNPGRPLVNCGAPGVPDTGIQGPGVCGIISTGDPSLTYDGNPGKVTNVGSLLSDVNCGVQSLPTQSAAQSVTNTSIGCGRPNVFQGRTGVAQNTGQANSVVFLGVPLDPPGTTTTRTIRITNVRGNAVLTGVSSTFTTSQIQMNISINGVSSVSINNPQQIVAYVQRGLVTSVSRNNFDYLQCNSENGSGTNNGNLAANAAGTRTDTLRDFGSYPIAPTGSGVNTPAFRFEEGFASSFKVRNISQILNQSVGGVVGNGTFNAGASYWSYGSGLLTNNPADLNQNVPGAIYNTESGFTNAGSTTSDPAAPGNPPQGFGTVLLTAAANSAAFSSGATGIASSTGVLGAGQATQGTRLAMTMSSVPTGATMWVSPTLYLYRVNNVTGANSLTANVTPATGYTTGVAVLVSTAADGSGAYERLGRGQVVVQVPTSNLIVYEVLFADPFSIERLDVPVIVAYTANLNSNLPQPGVRAQVAGGFAPFYTSAAAGQPSASLPVPRFTPGTTPTDLFLISKCACNLLFPYIVSTAGYDSGIALANSSVDPGSTFGFTGSAGAQAGTVQFWYYGTGATGGAPPATQCTNTTTPGACPGTTTVPGGQVLTYVASTGSRQWGLDNRAAGFAGYVITQAQFQFCHAFAYISALGAGPLTPGTSEGYLGLLLDNKSLAPEGIVRTQQRGENLVH